MRMSKSNNSGQWSVAGGQSVRFMVILLFTALLLTAHSSLLTPAFADDLHYNNILVGDRAAGMGGAYTAISDDPSGLYYNPAGIVFAPGRSFSASVNAFQYSQKEYKDVLGGNGWERKSSNLQPNYFGIIQPLGEGKVGFSYAVPDSRLEDQDQTFYNIPGIDTTISICRTDPNAYNTYPECRITITTYVINMNDTDYTYNFGPSYAIKLNDNLSVGTTLYVHYRDRELISNHFVSVDNDLSVSGDERYEWTNTYGSLTEWGIKPIIGVMWTPADKVSLGLTVSKNYILDTDRRLQTTLRGLDYLTKQPAYNVWDSDDNREFPTNVTAGVAYFPSESLLLSADISYYSEAGYTIKYRNTVTGGVSTESVPQEETVNVAIGAEYYPTERIALRGGLFTNMANTPELSSGKTDQPEHIDMYGLSLSISRFTRASSLTLGGSYSFSGYDCRWERSGPSCDLGTGEAQVFSGSESIQDVEMQNFTAFISAAFSY